MFSRSFRTLHFAARPRVVARHLGPLMAAAGLLSLVPATFAALDGRSDVALRYAAVIALLVGAGGAASRLRTTRRLQPNEALVITALGFVLSGGLLAFPMTGYGIAPIDAVFEAVSGVTTTGLSTLGSVAGRPAGFLFARAWLQWIGGLGVVVLVLAFVLPGGVAAKRLGYSDREAADFVGGTRAHARRIMLVYAALTVAAIAVGWLAGLDFFSAVLHALAAVSTGGFAPADDSLIALPAAAQAAVSLACFAGALSFSAYYLGSWRSFFTRAGTGTLLLLCAAGALALWLFGVTGVGAADGPSALEVLWLSVSAQTTAGFTTVPADDLTAAGKLVLIVQMLVGGDVGSTGGGLKVLRFLILGQLMLAVMLRASMPDDARLPLRVYGEKVERPEIEAAASLGFVYAAVLLLSWLAFLGAGYDPIDSLFDVASALGTAGLSVGVTAPDLPGWLKAVLCVDMLMGRVEVVAILVLLFPRTWIGRRRAVA